METREENAIAFLRKAYEVAVEHHPESPSSVRINPRELGSRMGLAERTIVEIVTQLIQSGFAISTLGMHEFMITKLGVATLN